MEIAEAERKTFDELKSNYRQALISNYHDLVQIGNILKQVAQRATIAHLSPVCQSQSAPKPHAAFPPP